MLPKQKYYKVINENRKHFGLTYVPGLNKDILPFQKDGSCVPGGIYFTTLEHIFKFTNYGDDIYLVDFPYHDPNFQWAKDEDKYRANMIILVEKYSLSELETYIQFGFVDSSSETFFCTYKKICTISPQINLLVNLTHLDLSGNEIKKIPDEIGHCRKLIHLILNNNCLTDIPDVISTLVNLEYCNFENNQITYVSETIGNCSKLRFIDLSYNKLNNIPKEIGNCSNLKNVYLHKNQLRTIPVELGNCSMLEILHLSQNQLQFFPEEIFDCLLLRILDLSHNQLYSISDKTKDCTNLRLFLNDNPITRNI